jgi:hypothetical protein
MIIKNIKYDLKYEPVKLPCSKCGKKEDRCWLEDYECFECCGRSHPPFFRGIRMQIIDRDKFRCVFCKNNGKIDVHHLDKDVRNNSPRNLITLCKQCHSVSDSEKGFKIYKKYRLSGLKKYVLKVNKNLKKRFKGV